MKRYRIQRHHDDLNRQAGGDPDLARSDREDIRDDHRGREGDDEAHGPPVRLIAEQSRGDRYADDHRDAGGRWSHDSTVKAALTASRPLHVHHGIHCARHSVTIS
jgi:hypothetical protein